MWKGIGTGLSQLRHGGSRQNEGSTRAGGYGIKCTPELDDAALNRLAGGVSLPADIPQRPTLPDYELIKPIGRGSYGDVWLARGVTGVFRAVKVVWRSRFPEDRPYLREFEGVTRFASISLREPSQLALLHAGRSDDAGFFYYVMELADDATLGRTIEPEHYVPLTLRELRHRRGQLPIGEVVGLAVALCRALASLHATGLVHRDIKPSNVVLVGGVPKLADVGLVAAASEVLTFVGTEGYVPPEGPGAPAADVYSLGKVIYELATGLDRNDYPRLPAALGSRPDRKELLELNEVVIRACDPRPEKRYSDAAGLLDELLLLQAGKSVRRLRAAERSVGRALRLAAALALVATVAGGGAWIENRRASEAEAQRDALRKRTEYLARISQARLALDRRDYNGGRRLLAEVVPKAGEVDLRGVEWGILNQQAKGDPAVVVRSGGPAIMAMKRSPTEPLYAVHDDSRVVVLYHSETHEPVRTIAGVQQFVGFSPDGKWLMGTATEPMATAQRWSVADGRRMEIGTRSARMRPLGIRGNDEIIGFVDARTISSKNKRTAAPEVMVWNFTREQTAWRRKLSEPGDDKLWEFFRGAVDVHGENVAVALMNGRGADAQFRYFVSSLTEVAEPRVTTTADFLPTFFRFSSIDHSSVVYLADSVKRKARVFDAGRDVWIEQSVEVGRWDQRYDWPEASAEVFTRGADILVAPVAEVAVRRKGFHGHGGPVGEVLPLTKHSLATATLSGELRVWSLGQDSVIRRERRVWNSHGASGLVAFSSDGEWIYVSLENGSVGVVSSRSLETSVEITEMSRPISCQGDLLWGISKDRRRLLAWHLRENRIVDESVSTEAKIVDVVANDAWSRVVYLCADGTLYFWDKARRIPPARCAEKVNAAWSFEMDAAGERVWFVDNTPGLHCLSLPRGEKQWSARLPAVPADMRLDVSERRLAVALENGEIELWSAANGVRLSAIASGKSTVQTLQFSGPPLRIVAIDRAASIHIIDIEFGTTLATIDDEMGEPALNSALSADGRRLAILGKTGQLRLLDFP